MKGKLIKKDNVYYLSHDFKDCGSTKEHGVLGKLSLKNCQAIENGYDLDQLFCNLKTRDQFKHEESFKVGFQKALEILGDKKFSELDMRIAYDSGAGNIDFEGCPIDGVDIDFQDTINSLQQTEWNVEILMGKECKLFETVCEKTDKLVTSTIKTIKENVLMLDKDGYLILKRI